MMMEGKEQLRDRWGPLMCQGLMERGRRSMQQQKCEGNEKINPNNIHVSTDWVGEEWNQDLINPLLIRLKEEVHLWPKEESWVISVGLSKHGWLPHGC